MPTTDATTTDATTTTTTSSSHHRRRRGRGRGRGLPPWFLLNYHACIGRRPNGTTAVATTRNEERIEASLWAARPPLPSNLFLQCPAISEDQSPSIVQAVGDLILFCVPVAHPRIMLENCDYFIYRADPKRPSLRRLPHPHPFYFDDFEASLLPRGDHFTIAALVNTCTATQFRFHLFSSEDWAWTSKAVPLDEPHSDFPVKIPSNSGRLNEYFSSTVVTLGGDGTVVGWVDLWSGILLYKVLGDHSVLREMPVPLPMDLINGVGVEGCPRFRRGIAFSMGCLKFAEVVLSGIRLPDNDVETRAPAFQIDDWTVTTWSNSELTNSWEDWKWNFTVKASEMKISDSVMSSPALSELLSKPQDGDAAAAERALCNLVVSEPVPSMDSEDVVYLMARVKYQQLKAWVLAVDMRNEKLVDVAEFGTATKRGLGVIFRASSILSKQIDPAATTSPPAITPSPVTGITNGQQMTQGSRMREA